MNFNRDVELKTCIICGLEKYNGIKINSGFICDVCEEEIVHTDVESEKYPFFVKRMKEIWLKNSFKKSI